jgi:class 3 adenylate cyclase
VRLPNWAEHRPGWHGAQLHVVEDDGRGLIWTGATRPTPTPGSPLAPDPERAPRSYTPAHLTEKILEARLSLEGERKQVTVLCADLEGAMELLADRDPEEARTSLDPVLERMMEAVHRYEGTVNQVMGDGSMALFGAPLAHEDHAVRACYAALRMQDAIASSAAERRQRQGLEVQIRVGLNSGAVVVRSIGNDLHMDYTAVGQTTHLAARLEQLARPGTTLQAGSVSYGQATSDVPVIDLFKHYVAIDDRDGPRAVREKLTGKLVTLDRVQAGSLPALLALLDVPTEDPRWETLDPPQRRRRTLEAV